VIEIRNWCAKQERVDGTSINEDHDHDDEEQAHRYENSERVTRDRGNNSVGAHREFPGADRDCS
jgi:hypothetical protein